MDRLNARELEVGDRVYDTTIGYLWVVDSIDTTILLRDPIEEDGFDYCWRVDPDKTTVRFIREGDVDG